MSRQRWAPLAAACLVALAVLLAAAVHCSGAPGAAGAPMAAPRRSGASAFDAAVAPSSVARCKKQRNPAGAACVGLPGRGSGGVDDDDKRVVPTGSNPLHNR